MVATVLTNPKAKLTTKDVETFNTQYPSLEVWHTTTFHDRFLICWSSRPRRSKHQMLRRKTLPGDDSVPRISLLSV